MKKAVANKTSINFLPTLEVNTLHSLHVIFATVTVFVVVVGFF